MLTDLVDDASALAEVDDLAQPLTSGPFTRTHDDQHIMSVLIGAFQRAGGDHALMITADHQHCAGCLCWRWGGGSLGRPGSPARDLMPARVR
jgi:hypothetical protein